MKALANAAGRVKKPRTISNPPTKLVMASSGEKEPTRPEAETLDEAGEPHRVLDFLPAFKGKPAADDNSEAEPAERLGEAGIEAGKKWYVKPLPRRSEILHHD